MLSIIIPCFNDHDSVGRLLESLSSAVKRYDFEVIVVDDNSTEGRFQDLAPWKKIYGDRLVLAQNDINQGAGPSRNIGLGQATGTDICFVDSDDFIDETFLFYYQQIARDHDFEVATFKYHYQRESDVPFSFEMAESDENIWAKFEKSEPTEGVKQLWQYPYMVMTINYPWNKFYKREFLIKNNIAFPDLRLHEDISFHWQAMTLAKNHYFALNYPPLLVHNRVPNRGRATDETNERRLLLVEASELVLIHLKEHNHLKMYSPIFLRFFMDVYFWVKDTIHASHKVELAKGSVACLERHYTGERLSYLQRVDSETAGRLRDFIKTEAPQ